MTETNINALCSVEAVFDGVDIEVTVEFSAGGGTFKHDELTAESRAKANQHPIPSITGLQSALDGKSNVGHGHSISDITNLTQQLANAKNSSAGVTVEPTFQNKGDGTANLGNFKANLYATSDFSGDLVEYDIAGGTFTLNDSVANPSAVNYFVADYNNGTPILKLITDVNLITESSIIPVYTVFRTGNTIHPIDWDSIGMGMVNKLHQRLVKTQRFQRETGVILSETATRIVNVSNGIIWYGANAIPIDSAKSDVDTCFLYYHSAGEWTRQLITQYNNTQYDNGTNLATLTANRYAVNWVWRGVENAKHIYIVLGGGDYTLAQAQASTVPPVPPIISGHCFLVGRIIVQKSASTAIQIDNTRDITFSTRAVVEHNDTTGRDVLNVHPKESITGLTILDSPEFADTQITPLAVEATYTPTVWSYLVGLFTTVPKSVKSHIVKIWERLQFIEDNVVLDYTAANAITTLTLKQDKKGNALNLVDFDISIIGENVDSVNNAWLTVNNNTTSIYYNGVTLTTTNFFLLYLRGQADKKFEGQLFFRKTGGLYAFHQVTNDTFSTTGGYRANNYGGNIISDIGNITRLDFTSINWKAGTRIKIIRR